MLRLGTKILIHSLLLAGSLSYVATPGYGAEAESLFSLINARLALMEDVALFKSAQGIAVEDLDREAQVIAEARQRAVALGLAADPVAELFAAQIRVAKAIQYRHLADWQNSPAPATGRDLATEIRPRLLQLGQNIVTQLLTAVESGALTAERRQQFHRQLTVAHVSRADRDALFDSLLRIRIH